MGITIIDLYANLIDSLNKIMYILCMHCLILEGPLYNESMEGIIKMIKIIPTIITTWNNESQEKITLLKKYALDGSLIGIKKAS